MRVEVNSMKDASILELIGHNLLICRMYIFFTDQERSNYDSNKEMFSKDCA